VAKKNKKKKPKRKPKRPSLVRDINGVRALAAEVREVANQIEAYADGMITMNVPTIRPLTGNFHRALETIRVFAIQQVLGKIMAHAARNGAGSHLPDLSPAPRERNR